MKKIDEKKVDKILEKVSYIEELLEQLEKKEKNESNQIRKYYKKQPALQSNHNSD